MDVDSQVARKGLLDLGVHITSISLALSRGIPVNLVSEIAGHSNASTTLNRYGHVIPKTQRQVADAMESLLGA